MFAAYMTRLPVRSRMSVDHCQHCGDALVERTMGAVGLQLIVLDEVDASFDQGLDLRGRGSGDHPDRGLDDGADERTVDTRR